VIAEAEAEAAGGRIATGGERPHNRGFFLAPTVLTDVPRTARILNEEPFGPVATTAALSDLDKAPAEANRLSFGLAAYAYTRSPRTANCLSTGIACRMLGINHHGLGLPETPFGGVGDSGYGSEGGSEAMETTTRIPTTSWPASSSKSCASGCELYEAAT
jgi:succinate-semialdehyde dehydrogenase/glutarate-semialdehyde dehydrogenase